MPAGTLTSDHIGLPPAPPDGGGYGGDGPGDSRPGSRRRASFAAVLVVLAATLMIFAALTSAWFFLRGRGPAAPLPDILWLNTAVLLASSAFLEAAIWCLKSGRRAAFNLWWTAGALCGLLFLLGQGIAWQQMLAGGFASGAAAFFYVLTATHAFHLLGGVAVLVWVAVRALQFELGPGRRTAAEAVALFWHFLDALWIYLLALFSFWR